MSNDYKNLGNQLKYIRDKKESTPTNRFINIESDATIYIILFYFLERRIDSYLRIIVTCDVSFGTSPDRRLVLNKVLIDITYFLEVGYRKMAENSWMLV